MRKSTEDSPDLSKRLLAAYQSLIDHPEAGRYFFPLAALLVDREFLSELDQIRSTHPAEPFVDALLAYRRHGAESSSLFEPSLDLIDDATERLMRDGRQHPAIRSSVARVLIRWKPQDELSLDHAERLLWLSRVDEATGTINQLINRDPQGSKVIQQGASLLEASTDPQALREAVRLWDQLASGSPQGSVSWHQSKLAAIRALQKVGDRVEAQRRARYVLLTMPQLEVAVRQQYEAFAQ